MALSLVSCSCRREESSYSSSGKIPPPFTLPPLHRSPPAPSLPAPSGTEVTHRNAEVEGRRERAMKRGRRREGRGGRRGEGREGSAAERRREGRGGRGRVRLAAMGK